MTHYRDENASLRAENERLRSELRTVRDPARVRARRIALGSTVLAGDAALFALVQALVASRSETLAAFGLVLAGLVVAGHGWLAFRWSSLTR